MTRPTTRPRMHPDTALAFGLAAVFVAIAIGMATERAPHGCAQACGKRGVQSASVLGCVCRERSER